MKKHLFLLYISLLISIVYSQDNSTLDSSKDIIITSSETNITYQFKQPTLCDSVIQVNLFFILLLLLF